MLEVKVPTIFLGTVGFSLRMDGRYAIGAHQKIKGDEGRIMPAMPAELKLYGVRGVGANVEVEPGLPDRAMLALFLPPTKSRFLSSAPTASRLFPQSIT
jgi:hypothetical protein